jgi:hypothetical protein
MNSSYYVSFQQINDSGFVSDLTQKGHFKFNLCSHDCACMIVHGMCAVIL